MQTRGLCGPSRYLYPLSLQHDVEIGPDLPNVFAEIAAIARRHHVGPLDAERDIIDRLDVGRPFGQYDHPIRKRDGLFDIVRNQQQRSAALPNKLRRVAFDQQLVLEIERSEGFVEQQYGWLVHQCPGQRHALAHAARERRRVVIGETVEPQLIEHRAAAILSLARDNAADFKTQHHVAERRSPRQQQILLKHVADILRLAGDLAAVPADTSRIRRQQSA